MKSYFRIQVPSVSLSPGISSSALASRQLTAGPAGSEPLKPAFKLVRGRLPNPAGGDVRPFAASRMIEETLTGGAITLELDRERKLWRIAPPAYIHSEFYLPATYGKWSRSGGEIIIGDASRQETYLALRQANKMSGQAVFELGPVGVGEFRSEWQRVAKPLPTSGQPPIWYGLAIAEGGGSNGRLGAQRGRAVVFSANQWFTFLISTIAEDAFRGCFPEVAFVLLTGYRDQSELAAYRGTDVDYELSLGIHWSEQAGFLNRVRESKLDDLLPFILRNAELLRALAMAALQETCVDYDERHVIIGDLSAASIGASPYTHTGECQVLNGVF